MTKELTVILDGSEIEAANKIILTERFDLFFQLSDKWAEKAASLVVTNSSQRKEMKEARTARLALKAIRVGANKSRIELKEAHLRYNTAVQEVFNAIESRTKPIEDYLLIQEKFAENEEKERLDELEKRRVDETLKYQNFIPDSMDFRILTEEDYQKFVSEWEVQLVEWNQEVEEKKKEKIEAKRLRDEIKQNKKILKEQERLKKIEALAKEKLQLEAIEAKRKLEAAPDRDKLISFSATIKMIETPEMESQAAKEIIIIARKKLDVVSDFILSQTKKL